MRQGATVADAHCTGRGALAIPCVTGRTVSLAVWVTPGRVAVTSTPRAMPTIGLVLMENHPVVLFAGTVTDASMVAMFVREPESGTVTGTLGAFVRET